jgi:ion channel POLLUX/CASTOR
MASHDFRAKLRYQLDGFIGGGAGKQLLFLAVITAGLVVFFTVLGLVVGVGPEPSDDGVFARVIETGWYYFGRVLDSGTFVEDSGHLNRMISVVVTVLGVVVAGLLISALAGNFSAALEHIRRTGAPVVEHDHFVVLGWSEKIFSVIDQLAEAYALEGRITVVVMAERDKVAMEAELDDKIQYRSRTKIVVRSGSSVAMSHLAKIAIGRARAVVVLVDERDAVDPDKADARVMKTLMAIFNHPDLGGRKQPLRVTAEVMQAHNQELAVIASNGLARVVKTDEMISKVILQTARISGLAAVYDELFRFEGNEFHFKHFPETVGRSFGELLLDFPAGLLAGVAKSDGSGHTLNPPSDHVIAADEELLILAEDERIELRRYGGPLSSAHIPPIACGAAKSVEHLLVLGWNPKIYPIIKEFDDYVAPGSTLTLVNALPIEARNTAIREQVGELASLELRHIEGQFTSRALMDQLQPHRYPLVMVLGDVVSASDAEDADTRAIIALLLLRDARVRSGQYHQRVCSEILDPKNRELAATTQINDIVISNEMISMVLAQITFEPRAHAVFEDLVRSEGSEIYVKALELYLPPGFVGSGQVVTFEFLILAAKARGELALGLQIYTDDPESKHGLVLNPTDRLRPFAPKPGDRMVVLAEDQG